MKKNWTMRVGAGLLALTLITSCFVGGTFAKYTTKGEGSDKARVAKFGVEVEVTGDKAFSTTYTPNTENADAVSLAVESSATPADNVVAPGTSSKEVGEGKGMLLKISGKPEVAVEIGVDFKVNKDIFLKQASDTYINWTKAPYEDTFNITEKDYYPVQFTLKLIEDKSENIGSGNGQKQPVQIASGNLEVIQKALNDYVKDNKATYAPNEELDATFELTWEWDFDDNGAGTNDAADTLLGNLAAAEEKFNKGKNNTSYGSDNYSTEINFECTVTVTQID